MNAINITEQVKHAITCPLNTLKPEQNDRHLAGGIFNDIFLNGNRRILIQISLYFVHKGLIDITQSDDGLLQKKRQAIT